MYPFETEFKNPEMERNKKQEKINNIKSSLLGSIRLRNLPTENESFMWLAKVLILCIVINLISFNIGTALSGVVTLIVLLIIISNINFFHSDEIDYYLYNTNILIKKIIFKSKILKKMYDNSEQILKYSVIIYFIHSLILNQIPIISNFLTILGLANPYGILVGLILCFVNQEVQTIKKNMKLFYLFQVILLLKNGVLDYFIFSSKFTYINHSIVFTTIILWGISVYLTGCNLNFINKGEIK